VIRLRTEHPSRPPPPAASDGVTPALALEEIAVRYGGIAAVKAVSLHVNRGEIVALLGANGAGKTSTLRAIARAVPLAAGRVIYAGQDVSSLPASEVARAGVSLVPEGRALFRGLTVRENLEIGAYAHRDRRVMRETFEDVTALFPRLGERMQNDASTLSGGEQQMLAIGRALMARPALLLLDEPSLGIAPKLVQQIFVAIRAIAEAGVTILLVEQNTRVALEVSARAYVLRAGEVALEGKSADLARDEGMRDAYLGG
jgi:branched-chain amino acid transport system ATP-binding protein